MAITPTTDVILLKCPLELSQDNQINFSNATSQYNYFYGLSKYVAGTNFTYQRKDGFIRIPAGYDSLINYNYVMYRNEGYSNKWFYAFIEKMEYINDGMTAVYIKTDVFQTWQFDLTYKRCFVEREHVNDDTIGKHTVPEGLETGEYQIVDHRDIPMWDTTASVTKWIPCFCVTALPHGCEGAVDGRVAGDNGLIGGVFNTLKFFTVSNLTAAKIIMGAYESSSEVKTDAIVNIYMIPRVCANALTSGATTYNGHSLFPLNNYAVDDNDGSNYKLQQPTALAESYTPVNKKLYVYPYSYVYMSNNAGEDIQLNWEDFPRENVSGTTMPTMTYYKYYVPSASLSAKLIFTKYKNYTSDSTTASQMANYGLTFAKVPVCAWTTDYYTNWLTQNGVNISSSIAGQVMTGIGGLAGSAIMGGPLGVAGAISSITSTVAGITSAVAQMDQATKIPPQAHGNLSTGDLVYSMKRNSISCYFMSIRKEMAQVIDGYFSMYGYKVNSVKVPNITGRTNWNYVKTIGSHILGDIPQEDMQEIKNMFDNGLTIWHNTSTFMDYSQSNAIV